MIRNRIFLVVLLLSPGFLQAQSYTLKEKTSIAARVDSLMYRFMHNSALAETGKNLPSTKVIRELKGLFLPEARIFDDINATYQDDGQGYPYKLTEKSMEVYFDELVEQFPERLVVENRKVNISYDLLEQGQITAALERSISGTRATGKYNLSNQDTLLIKIIVLPDQSVKISGITSIGSNLRVTNDQDLDGVIDSEDQCREQKGKLNLKGCPDRDDDQVPDRSDNCPDIPGTTDNHGCPPSDFAYRFIFSLSSGYSIGRIKMNQPGSAELGYNTAILEKNRSVVSLENPGMTGGIKSGASISYFYGKRKSAISRGIGLGFYYQRFQSTYNVSGSILVFHAFDDASVNPDGYRRIISLLDFKEQNTFTVIQFPLTYRLRSKMNANWSWEAGFGPAVSFIRTKTELADKLIYIEGYQQYDSVSYQPYYNPQQDASFSDLPLIREFISGKRGVTDPELLFAMLNDRTPVYDFGPAAGSVKKNKVKSLTGISIHAGFELAYYLSPRAALKAGLAVDYAPSALKLGNKDAKNYQNGDTPDDYNPLFNSAAKTNYLSFGLQLGLAVGLTKN